MARPLKKVDSEAIKKLAQLHCTYEEIAEFCEVSTKTLQRNYVHLIKKGREMGRISLRRAQFEKALGGNVAMQIWLGKQHLDQKDKQINDLAAQIDELKSQINKINNKEKVN